ncbi:MAG: hypothetical protein ACJA2G_001146, partial [Cognaticolwellia sp.]
VFSPAILLLFSLLTRFLFLQGGKNETSLSRD